MARTRITLQLGPQPTIPPDFLDDLDLPSLADQERNRYWYDAWGTYRAMLDLFLGEIRRRRWGVECDNEPTKAARGLEQRLDVIRQRLGLAPF